MGRIWWETPPRPNGAPIPMTKTTSSMSCGLISPSAHADGAMASAERASSAFDAPLIWSITDDEVGHLGALGRAVNIVAYHGLSAAAANSAP